MGSIQLTLKTSTGELELGCVDLKTTGTIKMTVPMDDNISDRVVSKVFLDNNCEEKLEEATLKEIKENPAPTENTASRGSSTDSTILPTKEFSFDPMSSKIVIRKQPVKDGLGCKLDKNCKLVFVTLKKIYAWMPSVRMDLKMARKQILTAVELVVHVKIVRAALNIPIAKIKRA